jgi:hypothetical protein
MAISRVAGQMLNSNLQRDGVNLAVETNLLYLDVNNGRIGVNTTGPSVALEVVGNIVAGNVDVGYGNLTGGNVITPTVTSITGGLTLSTGAAGNILINADNPGIVKIQGTNGVVLPVGNTAQRPAPADTGTLRYNTTSSELEIFNGVVWTAASGGTFAITNQIITPNGSSNTFTLNQSTSTAAVLVNLNGVTQTPATAYNVTGNLISFTSTPETTDIISVTFIAGVNTIAAVTNTFGNTLVRCIDTPAIEMQISGSTAAVITAEKIFDISSGHSLQLPVYDVANATVLNNVATGQLIYVSDGDTGNPCLAVYSNGAFKRISLGANISI